jgi:transposase
MNRDLKYVGIDAHATSCVFFVVSAGGKTELKCTVPTAVGAIRKLMFQIGPDCEVVFEEGEMSSWLYETIRGLARRVVVANPREHRSGRTSNKTDKIDAEKLARWLSRGQLTKLVYKEWHGTERLFHTVRSYNTFVSNRIRAKNRLKSLLRAQAVPARGTTPFAKTPRERMLARLTAAGVRERAEMLIREIEMLDALVKDAERAMTTEARRHPASKILQSIPGIGEVRSAQLIAAIRTPGRFRRNRELWTYAGLAVVRRGSSETDFVDGVAHKRPRALQTRGLNRNFNRTVKNALKGAATNASRSGELVPYYEALIARGLKPELALVTLARKIATLTLTLWKKGEKFDVTKSTSRSA